MKQPVLTERRWLGLIQFATTVALFASTACGPEIAWSQVRNDQDHPQQLFEVSVEKYLMGTLIEATVMHSDVGEAREILVDAFREMERIENVMSVHKESSMTSRVNREAADHPVKVSAELFGILERSLGYCRASGGLFDVTIGPLSKRWDFSGEAPVVVPDSAAIDSLRQLVGCELLLLNEADTTVAFERRGMSVDLGGIAKGYAVDRASAVLRQADINNFLVNAGGDLFVSGEKASGVPWRVGVKHPRSPKELIFKLNASNEAVVTSGDYERFVIIDGRRYHHVLDPRTGYPAMGSQSVTVLAGTAEKADALATILFVGGDKEGIDGFDAGYIRIGRDGIAEVSQQLSERDGFERIGR